jgi:hypothetical protein
MGPDSLQFLPTPDPTETATSYEGSVMRVTALKQLDSLLGLGAAGGGAYTRDFVPNVFSLYVVSFHKLRFTRAQGIPKYKIGGVGEILVEGGGGWSRGRMPPCPCGYVLSLGIFVGQGLVVLCGWFEPG